MTGKNDVAKLIGLIDQVARIHHFLKSFWGGKISFIRFKDNLCLDQHTHCFYSSNFGIPCFHVHLDPKGSWRYVFPDHADFLKLEKVFQKKKYSATWESRNAPDEWKFFDETGRLFASLCESVIIDLRVKAIELLGVNSTDLAFLSTKRLLEEIHLDLDQLQTMRKRAERLLESLNINRPDPAGSDKSTSKQVPWNEQAKSQPKLDETNQRIKIKGKWHELSEEQKNMLVTLFKAKGQWIGGKNIAERPDKIRRTMKKAVFVIIETDRHKGYRIPSLLPQ